MSAEIFTKLPQMAEFNSANTFFMGFLGTTKDSKNHVVFFGEYRYKIAQNRPISIK